MKTTIKALTVSLLSLMVTQCGAIENYLNDPELAETFDLNMLFDLTDDQADTSVGTPEEQAVIAVFREKQRAIRLQVAECAGFGEEAQALEEAKQALIAQGLSKEEIKAQTKAQHDQLRRLIDSKKDAVRTCHEQSKSSDEGLALAAGLNACFANDDHHSDLHDSEDRHRSDDDMHEESDDDSFSLSKKRKGRRLMGHKVPSLEYATFDSAACVEWIAANSN